MAILNQFVYFLCQHSLYFRYIDEEIVCAYIEKLGERMRSPVTIKNYISGLSATYARMQLPTYPFTHTRVKRALIAVEKTIRHTPIPASCVTPELLKSVLYVLSSHHLFASLRLLFIMMFMSLLRQSNFISQSVQKFDSTRQLTKGDVSISPDGLIIRVKWEKNHQSITGASTILLPPTNDIYLCPVHAYRAMLTASLPHKSSQPLISYHDGNNMTVQFVRKVWRAAMSKLGKDPRSYTLHGLRRGGTTFLASVSKGARSELKHAGRWNSNVYRRYIANPKACSVYNVWKRL